MDLPNENTLFILLCCVGGISLLTAMLFVTTNAAFASCILSETTFNKLREQKPEKRNKLLWLLNHPQTTQRALCFLQALFIVIMTFAFSLALYSIRPHLNILCIGTLVTVVGASILVALFQSIGTRMAVSTLKSMTSTTYFVVKIAQALMRFPKEESTGNSDAFGLGNLGQALEMQETEEEQNILNSVLHFGEETVAEIMIPRVDVVDLSYHADFKTVMQCVIENNYSRIPIKDNSQDKIKGILYVKDLLPYCKEGNDFEWQKLIRPPFFVPESKMIDDLLREFQKNKIHIAVVVDEYGITSGIVTMEDILEEIVGEINDEYDEEEKQYIRIDDKHYVFEGKVPLSDFFEIMDLNEADFAEHVGEAETLAGFVLELMNEFPTRHQTVNCQMLQFEVLALDKRRISKIKVTRKDEKADNAPVKE